MHVKFLTNVFSKSYTMIWQFRSQHARSFGATRRDVQRNTTSLGSNGSQHIEHMCAVVDGTQTMPND